MKVFAVGTGCTWFERNNTSFILDDTILFDTPNGSYKEIIKKLGITDFIKNLKAIFLTHFHADHIFDMHVIATRFMRESERLGRKENLKIFCPKGTLDKIVEINRVICGSPDECDKVSLQKHIDFIEVSNGDKFEIGKYKVEVYAMDHGDVYCQGYTFEENQNVIGFSADTKDCENLRKMLGNSNVAFVDMAALEPAKSHLDVERYMELEKEYKNCTMYAIHTSDETYEFGKNNSIKVLNDGDEINI